MPLATNAPDVFDTLGHTLQCKNYRPRLARVLHPNVLSLTFGHGNPSITHYTEDGEQSNC